MWNWFKCYLSGRHDFGAWCEPGTIFLRCVHCGKRSSGWALDARAIPALAASHAAATPPAAANAPVSRVAPFPRAATRSPS